MDDIPVQTVQQFSDTSMLCENDRLDLRSTFNHITYPINFICATALICVALKLRL